jgi:hypothetical protein
MACWRIRCLESSANNFSKEQTLASMQNPDTNKNIIWWQQVPSLHLAGVVTQEQRMKFVLLSAVAVAATALAAPVAAQAVISDPGYCAQFYPDANCQNLGPGNPYTGDYQARRNWQDNYAYMARTGSQARHHHHRTH